MNLKPYAIVAGLTPAIAGAAHGIATDLFNQAQKGIPQNIERAFYHFDRDGNGYIDRREADGDQRLSRRLDSHDGDGDGRLNKVEFTALVTERGNRLADEVLRTSPYFSPG